MATIWKSNQHKTTNQKSIDHAINRSAVPDGRMRPSLRGTISSWVHQKKIAMAATAGFAIVGLLLVVTACSKQSPKPALVGVSSPAPTPLTPTTIAALVPTPTVAAAPAPRKKAAKTRPANVSYSDPNSGISFLYPRKFSLSSGEKAQPVLAGVDDVPMNFVQPGGVAVATVAVPSSSYPGTDFASAFFNVNVNRSLSEQECEHFAFVDTRNADGEPVDAEKVKVGSSDMEMTSDFSASAIQQAETQYYHSYDNGVCYEYVLGLGTEGYATEGGIEHVNRDEVFARLEKILATVKINPAEQEHVAEQTGGIASGKE
jgi:hypothetical protein